MAWNSNEWIPPWYPKYKSDGVTEIAPGDADRDFLLSLDRQLADAVTFLPPAMRASFHARVGALIKLVTGIMDANPPEGDAINRIYWRVQQLIQDWRAERQRITERTK